MHLNMSFAEWCPFWPGGDELTKLYDAKYFIAGKNDIIGKGDYAMCQSDHHDALEYRCNKGP